MNNILFIFMDQLRADYLGCYGAKHLNTPNIDQLASESRVYDQCISPSPLCVPARASLMTGKSSLANRVVDNSLWINPDHDAMGIHTWPKQLADQGYFTCAVGKMHFYPWDLGEGFDKRIIAEDKRHIRLEDDYTDFLKNHGYRRMHGEEFEGYYEHQGAVINTLPDELQIDRYVADKTCDVIKELEADKPFALMVGFPGPHCPYDPTSSMLEDMPEAEIPKPIPATKESESFREMLIASNKREWNKVDYTEFSYENKMRIRKHYSALIQGIDSQVGKILKTLADKGLMETTTIVLSADHGDLVGDFDLIAKHFFYEGAIKVPLMIKYPGLEPSHIDEAVSLTDLYATLLGIGGVQVPSTVDSTDLLSAKGKLERAPIFGATNIGWMIRDSHYKYCEYENGTVMLYDIVKDQEEQKNLINDKAYGEVKEKMSNLLRQRMFSAIDEANLNLKVLGSDLDDGFYKRDWVRPHPKRVQ